MSFNRNAGGILVQGTGNIFLPGQRMAVPLMAIHFVAMIPFATLGKAAAGMNAFTKGVALSLTA